MLRFQCWLAELLLGRKRLWRLVHLLAEQQTLDRFNEGYARGLKDARDLTENC